MYDGTEMMYDKMSLGRLPKTSIIVGKQMARDVPGIFSLRDQNNKIRPFSILFKTNNVEFQKYELGIFRFLKGTDGVNIRSFPSDFSFLEYQGEVFYNNGGQLEEWKGDKEIITETLENCSEWMYLLSRLWINKTESTFETLCSEYYTEQKHSYPIIMNVFPFNVIINCAKKDEETTVDKKSLSPGTIDDLYAFIKEMLVPFAGSTGGRKLQQAYIDFCGKRGHTGLRSVELSDEMIKRGLGSSMKKKLISYPVLLKY